MGEDKPICVTKPRPMIKPKRKCICDTAGILGKITGVPQPIPGSELNKIRLGLFLEKNSDGTGFLVLRGNDLHDRFKKRIQDSDIRAIVLFIREHPRRITKLDLCYNEITDAGFFKLLKRLLVKGRSSLINLNVMNNNLTEKSIENLAKYATFIKLRYLRISGNAFGTKGGNHLSQFLIKNKTVQFLDISQTDTTLTSVAKIITALRKDYGANDTLKVLELSRIVPLFDRYSFETKWLAYHIGYLLEGNSTIIELHLQKNEFNGHDMEYFARGLRKNDALLYLDLGFNKIGDYGVELIAKWLAEQPALIFLNVAGNRITETGAIALGNCIPFSKVRALDISKNKINERGLLEILNSIKKVYYMRFLNMWGNEFGHIACHVIQRMLDSGVLFQHTIDVYIYEVDDIFYAAYFPNPADRSKHLYYCELEFGTAQPIYHISRNFIPNPHNYKVDCKFRHKLDKTNKQRF